MTSNREWPHEIWCEHTKIIDDSWFYSTPEQTVIMRDVAKFCEICGKPRPEEPKVLWETMEMLLKDIPLTADVHKRISTEAIKWFKGKLPENSCDPVMVSIIQLLDKEIEKSKWGK